MTAGRPDGLRIALLNPFFRPEVHNAAEGFVHDLGRELSRRGHSPTLITSHPGRPELTEIDGLAVRRVWRPPQGQLQRRMYEDYLTHVPLSYAALRGGDFDLAHAAHPADALAAGRWARRNGRPSLLTYLGIPRREELAARRLRLSVLERALAAVDVTVVPSEAAREAFRRWLGVEVQVIEDSVDDYERLYRELLAR